MNDQNAIDAEYENRQWHIEKEWADMHWEESLREDCTRQEVVEIIEAGAMIRVQDGGSAGFMIILRPKNKNSSEVTLYANLKGGLSSGGWNTIFYPYEFSMHKYVGRKDVRAATEYVRRKLSKMVG